MFSEVPDLCGILVLQSNFITIISCFAIVLSLSCSHMTAEYESKHSWENHSLPKPLLCLKSVQQFLLTHRVPLDFLSLKIQKRQSGCCAIFIQTLLPPPAHFIRSRTKPLGSQNFEAHGGNAFEYKYIYSSCVLYLLHC